MRLAEQLLFLCVNSKITVCHAISCHMSYVKCLSSSTSKSDCFSCYHMSHKTVTLSLFQSLIHSLSTCWTTFVFMSMLKVTLWHSLSHSLNRSCSHSQHAEHSFHVYAQKSISDTHILSLSPSLTHTLTLSLSHSHIHSIATCWTTSVLMSMLRSQCLLVKMVMIFLVPQQQHTPDPLTLEFIELAGSQLKPIVQM